jgi:hypothetical protein
MGELEGVKSKEMVMRGRIGRGIGGFKNTETNRICPEHH